MMMMKLVQTSLDKTPNKRHQKKKEKERGPKCEPKVQNQK